MKKEKVEDIKRRLKDDPYVVIDRNERDERVHVNLRGAVKKALTDYLFKNKRELRDKKITSRNKLIASIVEEWCKENNLNIED